MDWLYSRRFFPMLHIERNCLCRISNWTRSFWIVGFIARKSLGKTIWKLLSNWWRFCWAFTKGFDRRTLRVYSYKRRITMR
ncbi:unnamed protein product [Blepharisma stoltei]|uniref:Uncharacterized protein n=1 Tax=Blepharisma stoltei TaxID=1481888 RepID=A0AAU9IQQ2_9CILI|nr:unnamed protein product [Blepharisma stoltei]